MIRMRFCTILVWLAGIQMSLAQTGADETRRLSPDAYISVITCGPWDGELYTAFGHSAIRVYDPQLGINDAYNYGVFDFNQPNFYINYTKGLLLFKLGVYSYPDFRDSYIYYNRSLTEQVINLTDSQKQAVFNYLEWNARPENETYRYDYFYDNCASRVRDVFAIAMGDSVRFDSTYIQSKYTIRQLTDLYLKDQPWGDLGIDICLGLPMDKVASPYEYMFLPDYVLSSFSHATVYREGKWQPLVLVSRPVYTSYDTPKTFSFTHPWIVFGVFLLITLAICWHDWRRKKVTIAFDFILFTITGAVGVLLILLWTATDHKAAANNLNILWAIPFNLIIWLYMKKSLRKTVGGYLSIVAWVYLMLIITWWILPQQMNNYLLPVVAAVMARCFVTGRILRS